jgi:copper ion binding protein
MNTTVKVEGMTCSHCEQSVKAAVSALPGVSDVEVNLHDKMVTVIHDGSISSGAIKNEIEDLGYDVV